MCFLFFFVGIYLFRKPHASGLHHPIFCVGFEGADFARVKKTSHSTVQLCFFFCEASSLEMVQQSHSQRQFQRVRRSLEFWMYFCEAKTVSIQLISAESNLGFSVCFLSR